MKVQNLAHGEEQPDALLYAGDIQLESNFAEKNLGIMMDT